MQYAWPSGISIFENMNAVNEFLPIISFFYGGIIFVGLFILLLLLKQKTLGISRFYINAVLIFFLLQICTLLLFTSGIIQALPHLLGLVYPFLFLIGPAFYFFIVKNIKNNHTHSYMDLLHLLPFLIVFARSLPTYFNDVATKQEIINYYYEVVPEMGFDPINFILSNAFIFSILIYSLAGQWSLKKSSIPKQYKYNTLWNTCIVVVIFCIIHIILHSGLILYGSSLITSELILTALLTLVFITLGYLILGLRNQPFIDNVSIVKYKNSTMNRERIAHVEIKLKNAFEQDKIFLQSGLMLEDIATHIAEPSHIISQVMNTSMQTNFYDLTSVFRVQEAKKMLLNGTLEKLSIQAIGEECGFSSKASFYRAFKKWVGKTPTEFIRSGESINE